MGSRLESNSNLVRKRIEKHTFDNEEGEEYEGSKFGGFPEYFRRKKIKLQNRDTERRVQNADKPRIFRGVVAHVNGYTQPSLNDLHDMIVDYGGGFMQYLDGKTTVTHIIASNLTPKKKIEFRAYRIVKPAWVVDSIKAGRLLPWDAYRVVDEGVSQRILGVGSSGIQSQANTLRAGYRDQTDTSWYTSQVKNVAQSLDRQSLVNTSETQKDDEFPASSGLFDTISSGSTLPLSAPASPPSAQREIVEVAQEDTSISVNRAEDPAEGEVDDVEGTISKSDPFTVPSKPLISPDVDRVDDEEAIKPNFDEGYTAQLEALKEAETRDMTAEQHNALLLSDPRVRKSTVVDPGFLKQYYEESRLHHLSAWKADLKSKLQALAAEKTSSQKAKQKRPPGSRRYILHVDFDSFFAAVSLRKHPEYIDKPVVVAHGGGSGSEIASCNYPARKFGIKNGMWMKHAQKMCSELKVLPYDFKAYEEASKSFYEVIMDTGGVIQSISVDEALVDVTVDCIEAGGHRGMGVHEGSIWREQAKADEIAQNIRDSVKARTGCAVSVGIGGNILLAKVALRKAKPAGQYQIRPEMILDFLADLTVQELPGVAYSIGGKLEEIGVKYINDIRQLSKGRLIAVLGPKTGEKIWDYSRGIDRTEVGEQVVRKSVSAEVNWGIRFVTQEQADEFVTSLCEELHKRLMTEGVKGRQITMKIMRKAADAPLDPPKHLGHGKCDTFNKSIILSYATNEKDVISREALSILKGWRFPPGELRGIGVQMTRLEPIKGTLEKPEVSSQKRLQFSAPSLPAGRSGDATATDEIEPAVTPQKPRETPKHPASVFASEDSPSGNKRAPLNTLGTQFVLPSQVDPDVLAELPQDIRSKFTSIKATLPRQPSAGSPPKSPLVQPASSALPSSTRSNSPSIPPDALPSHSQLDPETIEALPPDVRAEVLAFYQTNTPRRAKARAQALLPQSPRKSRIIPPSKSKTTPTRGRKRIGLLSRSRPTSAGFGGAGSTLTQSNFVAARPTTSGSGGGGGGNDPFTTSTTNPDPEFLAALPPDIRSELLAQARRERLAKRGGIAPSNNLPKRYRVPKSGGPAANSTQRRIKLPARKPRITFTSQKLFHMEDLREALKVWYEEFRDEGPYEEDVGALVGFLRRVILGGDSKGVGKRMEDEERKEGEGDLRKGVDVGRWFLWVVEEGEWEFEERRGRMDKRGEDDEGQEDEERKASMMEGREKWKEAVERVREGISEAVVARGLGVVEI